MFVDLFRRGHGSAVRDYDAAGAHRLMSEGAVVIDVRTPAEAAAGMLPGAQLVPLAELPARIHDVERLVSGNKASPIIVYCRSGNRSGSAKAILQQAGFTQVVNAGGYDSLR